MAGGGIIIEVENMSKVYGWLPALNNLNFSVRRGEFLLVLGANGSGKSTLLHILSGLSKPSSGQIRIGGWEMPREAMAARGQIGLVAHQPLLYENLTARENLRFFSRLYGLDRGERAGRITELLGRVELQKRADSLVRTYSRGMKQRLSIARALLHRPEILLLDEPYTGLDQAGGELLNALLEAALGDGRTIIMSTHQMERAAQMARRALILSGGGIRHDGPAEAYQRAMAAPKA